MRYELDARHEHLPAPKLKISLDVSSNRRLLTINALDGPIKPGNYSVYIGKDFIFGSDGKIYDASSGSLKALKLLTDSVDCHKWRGLATIEMHVRYLEFALSLLGSAKDIDLVLSDTVVEMLDRKRVAHDAPIDLSFFEGELFPHQEKAVRWLRMRFCGGRGFALIADEQGVGKTVEVCAFLGDLYARDRASNTLIVCPASVIQSWEAHLAKHLPQLDCLIVTGPQTKRVKKLQSFEYDVAVISVDMMRRDEAVLSRIHWDCLVLDEATAVKNHSSKNRSALRRIRADRRIGLTGTPAPNGSPRELHGILGCLSADDYLGSEKAFNRRFTRPIESGKAGDVAEALKHLVRPCMLRRLKDDVLDLPEKTESELLVELPEEQLEAYKVFEARIRSRLQGMSDDEFEAERIGVIGAFTHLRQIAVNPAAVIPEYSGRAVKIDVASEMAVKLIAEGHRVVIFTLFVKEVIGPLCQKLEFAGVEYLLLTGDVPMVERAELINKFNSPSGPSVFVMSGAGGEGINLQAADVQIQISPFYNHAVTDQAADRIHRIGQCNETRIYKMIAKDTIEMRMKELRDKKWSTLSSIMRQGERPLTKLTRLELLELLG